MKKTILVITDNVYLFKSFKNIVDELRSEHVFVYRCSPKNELFKGIFDESEICAIDVKASLTEICKCYDLVVSLHCKQIFPKDMVNGVRCVNVHPGLNPYNRGWYPQVFSILNGLPAGATIHEIDELLDHGMIIDQQEVKIESWDTSATLYNKVLETELNLVRENLLNIIEGKYCRCETKAEGNINSKEDFNKLLQIDPHKRATYGEVINHLRALTFAGYRNAFFLDEDGKKVNIEIELKPDSDQALI